MSDFVNFEDKPFAPAEPLLVDALAIVLASYMRIGLSDPDVTLIEARARQIIVQHADAKIARLLRDKP